MSYATSPAVAVAKREPLTEPATAIGDELLLPTIEFAGILAGAKHEAAAPAVRRLPAVDADVPERHPDNMYVYPVRTDHATLPEAFTKFAVEVDKPLMFDPTGIGENREPGRAVVSDRDG